MSRNSTSWFHCGHCGVLFQAPIGRDVGRICSSCGREPSLGVQPIQSKKPNPAPAEDEENHKDRQSSGERHKKRRAKKKNAPMLLVILVWSVVMAGILVIANRKWKGPAARTTEESATQTANRLTDDEIQFLNRYADYSTFVVANVLSNTSPEAISPFVLNAPSTFSDIARFYPINPGVQMIEPKLERESLSILRLPDGPAIEGRWVTEDGRRIEAVFRLQEDELLLDWHHFVRFGDVPWSLFLSGAGPEEAEFRLLARRRLTRMVLDRDSSRPLSVEFYAPRFGNPDDHGPPSPPFDLDWNSEAATMLSAAFEQAGEGRQPFESLLPAMESDDEMIRVRVVVRRIDEEETMRFEIVEVRACHWLQYDDPGIHSETEGPE